MQTVCLAPNISRVVFRRLKKKKMHREECPIVSCHMSAIVHMELENSHNSRRSDRGKDKTMGVGRISAVSNSLVFLERQVAISSAVKLIEQGIPRWSISTRSWEDKISLGNPGWRHVADPPKNESSVVAFDGYNSTNKKFSDFPESHGHVKNEDG